MLNVINHFSISPLMGSCSTSSRFLQFEVVHSHNSVQFNDGIALAHFTKLAIESGAGGLIALTGLYELSSFIHQP